MMEKTPMKPKIVPADASPTGYEMQISHTLDYTAADLRGPFTPDPYGWSWENIRPTDVVRLTAPKKFTELVIRSKDAFKRATINHSSSEPRNDGRILTWFWLEPSLRSMPVSYDPLVRPNVLKEPRTISAEDSPSGTALRIIQTISLSHADIRQNAKQKLRYQWPFKDMVVGDAIEVIAPTHFANQAGVTGAAYRRKDGSITMRSKRYSPSPDGRRSVLIWCEAAE
jgi:hypothetical protein